jgi:hypothetical protein
MASANVIPFKRWLEAKKRRASKAAPMQPDHYVNPQGCMICQEHCCADCECNCHGGSAGMQASQATDCMDLPDVVHSAEFDARMLRALSNPLGKPAIRGKAVPCDVNITK